MLPPDLAHALQLTAPWLSEALGANPDDESRVAKALRRVSVRCHPDKTSDARLHEAMLVLRKYVDENGSGYLLLCWRQFTALWSASSLPSAAPPPSSSPGATCAQHMEPAEAQAFADRVVALHRQTRSLGDKNARDIARCLVQILTGTHKHEALLRDILPCRGQRDFVLRFFRSVDENDDDPRREAVPSSRRCRRLTKVGSWLRRRAPQMHKQRLASGYIQTSLQLVYNLGLRPAYLASTTAAAAP